MQTTRDHARALPGEVSAIQGRLQEIVQQGFPGEGWEGDPLLILGFDHRRQEWTIHDRAFTPPSKIMAMEFNGMRALDVRTLCAKLKAGQVPLHGGNDLMARVEAKNEAMEADRDKDRIAGTRANHEELAYYLGRELNSGDGRTFF